MEFNDKLTLIFESPDGGGKSTLIKELHKRHPNLELVDRGFISDAVYAKKFNREHYEGVPVQTYTSYWAYWHAYNRITKIILCLPSIDTLVTRCFEKDEPFCKNKTAIQVRDLLEKDVQLFKDFTGSFSTRHEFDVLEVNTDEPIKDTLRKIEDFINDYKL